MSEEVRYAGNVVSWEAVFGIEKYVVQVNDGEQIEVTDGTSCEIELTKAGENIIRVCSVDAEGKLSEWVTTTVTGYEISFVTDTETGVDSVYRAPGDKLNLPTELERTGYDFSGWYSEPNGGGTAYGEGRVRRRTGHDAVRELDGEGIRNHVCGGILRTGGRRKGKGAVTGRASSCPWRNRTATRWRSAAGTRRRTEKVSR